MGEMANMFFSSLGSLMFYVCIVVYLFGDLSIYSAAVSTTLRDVIWYAFDLKKSVYTVVCCLKTWFQLILIIVDSVWTYEKRLQFALGTPYFINKFPPPLFSDRNTTLSPNETVNTTDLCWAGKLHTRFDIYRICLIFFTLVMSPFVFFNVQKTKYLQILTIVFRWLGE